MKSKVARLCVLVLVVAFCLTPSAWAAEAAGGDNPYTEVGLGAASFLCSIPYGAAKIAVAVLGGVTGAFTYVLSGFDKRAADAVWRTSLEGDYVVTPDHLRGKKELHFTGVPPDNSPNGR